MKVEQSPNILNWYPFNKNQKILIIENQLTKELIEYLKNNCNEVKEISQIEQLDNVEQKFDIIILIGTNEIINFECIIKRIESNLNADGKILIAIDNKFGLRFWAGNPENILNKKFESLIGYSNETKKIETFTKSSLDAILKKLGYDTKFYYPLPDYRMPNVIFSDEQLPEYNSVDKYNPYYTDKSDILFDEIDVFREILKTNKEMFRFFANSFLVEATKGECDRTYKYISFNNLRKEEFRLITKISDKYVEKQVVDEKANKHYENIKNNIQILQNNEIETVDYIENEIIKSRYTNPKYLLNNVLTEKLEQNKMEEFYNILDKYISTIKMKTYKEKNYENTVFKKYGIDIENKEIIENLNFAENGLWDMTFKNCFLVDNKFLFFDQEWNEKNLPVEFILYRSILYTISLRRYINIDDLFEKYNIKPYLGLFKQLDNKLQKSIRDDERWDFYNKNCKFNIDETKQELINLNIRSNAQNEANENLRKECNELKEMNNKLQQTINNQQNEIRKLQIELKESVLKKIKRKLKNMKNK